MKTLLTATAILITTALLTALNPLGTLPTIETIQKSKACKEAGCQINTLASAATTYENHQPAFLRHFITFEAFPNVTADITTTPTGVRLWNQQRTHAIRITIREAPPTLTTTEFLTGDGATLWKTLTGNTWPTTKETFCNETQATNRIRTACAVTSVPHPFIPGYPSQDEVTLITWRTP